MNTGKPNGRPPSRTGLKQIERRQRLARILNMRCQGFTLGQIGDVEGVSLQRVHQLIIVALDQMVFEPLEEARRLEAARLDECLTGIYERAVAGDIVAVDRVLAIGDRRARLMNLYPQRPVASVAFGGEGFDPDKVRIEVVGTR